MHAVVRQLRNLQHSHRLRPAYVVCNVRLVRRATSLPTRRVIKHFSMENRDMPPNQPSEATTEGPWRGDLTFDEVKEKFLRPLYLPVSFTLGTLTLGLKTAADNFVLTEDPLSFIGCAVVSGCITMAIAWVLFDFTDNPPSGGNFSSPK